MRLDPFNRWITLLANVAVFASIMFLAIEIRQNQTAIEESNRLSVLEARTLEIEQFNQWRGYLIENPDLAKIWDTGMKGEPLDSVEELRFMSLCNNIVWISAGSFERSRALGRPDAAAATTSIRAEMIGQSPHFRACWAFMAPILRNYGVNAYVDEVEAKLGSN
jgi:hypothetical protein